MRPLGKIKYTSHTTVNYKMKLSIINKISASYNNFNGIFSEVVQLIECEKIIKKHRDREDDEDEYNKGIKALK